MKQVRLNRVEIWIADHALPVFAAVAVAIVAGAVAIFVVFLGQQDTQNQVNVLRPQVTKVSRAICDSESLKHPDRAARCAERIRIGLVNCRKVERCRAALIAAITYPPPTRGATEVSSSPDATSPEGGGAQNPSTAGQQPTPGSPGGGHGEGHGQGHKPGPKSLAPTPGAEPAPGPPDTGPDTGSPAGPPGQGGEGGPGQSESKPPPGAGKSGVELEACALAVCAEVGVGR